MIEPYVFLTLRAISKVFPNNAVWKKFVAYFRLLTASGCEFYFTITH